MFRWPSVTIRASSISNEAGEEPQAIAHENHERYFEEHLEADRVSPDGAEFLLARNESVRPEHRRGDEGVEA